jgi:hypothetical protein
LRCLNGELAGETPESPEAIRVPDYISTDVRDNYLTGWRAGKLAVTAPLSDEVARDVVLILYNEATMVGLVTGAE